jgi:glycosyltransferase involved in cell wall biosynthesis
MMRQWSINGRFVTQPFSGVQRYAYEIVQALDTLIGENHELTRDLKMELLVPKGADRLPELGSISIREIDGGRGHAWEQTRLPRAVTGALLSLCNTGPLTLSRQIVCLHDMNTRVYPESYSFAFRTLYRALFPLLGRRARMITTVSRYSADRLVEYGVVSRERLRVMSNGHEHALRWRAVHSGKTRAVAGRNTIVVLGSPAPHKNVSMLLGLAGDLMQAGLRIAVIGSRDSRVFQTGNIGVDAGNVVWLGRLSDDEIAALLEDCLCLAFPSFVEGFGLPAVEAMARGCPVVSSDAASLPEICGEAALYADPRHPQAWRDQLVRLAGDADLRARLIERGRSQILKYSWRESALRYLSAFEAIDRGQS